jgi:hypothetical protein
LSGLQKHSDPAPWINAVWDKVKKHGYKKFSRWDDHLGLTYQGTNIDRARNYDDVVSSEGFQLKKQLKRQLGSLVKTYQLDISSFYEGGGTWTLNIGARRPEGDKVDWKKETRQLMKLDGYKFDGEESSVRRSGHQGAGHPLPPRAQAARGGYLRGKGLVDHHCRPEIRRAWPSRKLNCPSRAGGYKWLVVGLLRCLGTATRAVPSQLRGGTRSARTAATPARVLS